MTALTIDLTETAGLIAANAYADALEATDPWRAKMIRNAVNRALAVRHEQRDKADD